MRNTDRDTVTYTKSRQGFTIVELLIVIVVIAILASITIISYNGITKRAKDASIQSTLSQATQKIELAKLNDTGGVYPASMTAAGLDSLVSSTDTTYTYGVSSDGKTFCMALSKGGRTFYITSAVLNPKTGICNGAVGVPGTGDVATDGASVVGSINYTVFGSTAPAANQVESDGGGSLIFGNRFYTNEASGIKVTGLRIYNPTTNSSPAFLSAGITAYAYTHNWTGTTITSATTFAQSPVATKTFSGTRTAGTWTEILFDSPITLAPKNTSSGPVDYITLAVRYDGGNYYVYTPSLNQFDSIESTARPNSFLTLHQNIGRGVNTLVTAETATYYGIDMVYTPVTP